MKRRRFFTAFILAFFYIGSGIRLSAEITRLPFFAPEAVFTESPCAFPTCSSWMLLDQVLNQHDAIDTAHCFDLGTIMTFWSARRISVSGLAREIFQFKPNPDNDYKFWSRALVTDLRLTASFKVSRFILGTGYRHDCKHDISDTERTVIHDAVFAQALYPVSAIPFLPNETNVQGGFALEAEANLPTIFQAAEPEPDRGRLSAEGVLVPFRASNGHFRTFIDGRVSLIGRMREDRIAVESCWNVDYIVRAGPSFNAGQGEVSLFYSLERITDGWATVTPEPRTISAVTLLIAFGVSKP